MYGSIWVTYGSQDPLDAFTTMGCDCGTTGLVMADLEEHVATFQEPGPARPRAVTWNKPDKLRICGPVLRRSRGDIGRDYEPTTPLGDPVEGKMSKKGME